MRTVGNIARHGKPLTIAVLVLFAFLTGYTAFHYHPGSHCHGGDCTIQQSQHDTGEEITASQADCNICFYAATPKIVHAVEHIGSIERGIVVASHLEESFPRYSEEYTFPLRGPPTIS